MDIGTIQQRLAQGVYSDPSEVAADVAQVWTNCRTFNEPSAEITKDAAQSERAFIQFWNDEGVYQGGMRSQGMADGPGPSSSVVPGSGGGGIGGGGSAFRPTATATAVAPIQPTATAGGSGSFSQPAALHQPPPSNPKVSADWYEAARKVIYRMINFVTHAAWFTTPVSEEDVPDYHEIIKQPMDLTTVLEKIKSAEYSTPGEVVTDVELIWKNAEVYNGLQHPVAKAASQSRETFLKLWNSAGLDPESQQQRFIMLEQRKEQNRQSVLKQQQKLAAASRARAVAPAAVATGGGGGGGNESSFVPPDTQQEWVFAVRRVLSGIMNSDSCSPFNGPVSDTMHPAYPHIVENHMDFGQILRNLGRGRYQNSVQVMQDVRLLFSNWRTYGEQTGDPTYQTAGLEVANTLLRAWQIEGLPTKD